MEEENQKLSELQGKRLETATALETAEDNYLDADRKLRNYFSNVLQDMAEDLEEPVDFFHVRIQGTHHTVGYNETLTEDGFVSTNIVPEHLTNEHYMEWPVEDEPLQPSDYLEETEASLDQVISRYFELKKDCDRSVPVI